jgi:hypothetical protein
MRSSTQSDTFRFTSSPDAHEHARTEFEAAAQSRAIRDWGVEIAIERTIAGLLPNERP